MPLPKSQPEIAGETLSVLFGRQNGIGTAGIPVRCCRLLCTIAFFMRKPCQALDYRAISL